MPSTQPIKRIRDNVDNIRKSNGLNERAVTILGASKGQSADRITEVIGQGITDFGENRVQEAQEKWPALKQRFPDTCLHLIGPLQTNKVKQALALFDVIQTVDRPKLADAIAHEMGKYPDGRPHRFFIQVNIGEEPQKTGVSPEETDAFIHHCRDILHLRVVGLMCIPPNQHPPAPYFALLRTIALRNNLPELSMGMSEDYETAVRMGATCIRLGRVMFGEREAASVQAQAEI